MGPFGRSSSINAMAHGWPSTCKHAEDSALLLSNSFSPASTVMRHAFVMASALDGRERAMKI
jgi:hypothetical protein